MHDVTIASLGMEEERVNEAVSGAILVRIFQSSYLHNSQTKDA